MLLGEQMNTGSFCIHFSMEVLFITKERENPINEQIKVKEMMVIGPNGEQLGIKSKQDALTLAKYAGFDLVLMSDNATPAVCKIMDYNKFRYEKKKVVKYHIQNLLKKYSLDLAMSYLILLKSRSCLKWKADLCTCN